MSMPPSLIGAPVAFFPVPAPHLLAVAPAAAEPTFAVDLELAAVASAVVASNATGRATAKAILRSIIPRPPSSDVNSHVRGLDGHLAARASGCRGDDPPTAHAPMQDAVRHIRKRRGGARQ